MIVYSVCDIWFAAPWLYLDPGSGSFIVQLIIATALGAGVALRLYWSKIKSFLTAKKSASKDSSEDPNAK